MKCRRLRQTEMPAILMPMPEAAVYENYRAVFEQDEIGPPGQFLGIDSRYFTFFPIRGGGGIEIRSMTVSSISGLCGAMLRSAVRAALRLASLPSHWEQP
jgi:hypothetical protein